MAVGKKLFHIAIVTNFNIPEKLQDAMQVAEKLLQFGCHVRIPQRGQSRITAERPKLAEVITFLPFEKLYKNLDAVIVLGGDGTILESARYAALNGVPVIGMNLGRLGYLAELEMNEIMLLEKIVGGEYMVDERSLLKVSIKSQKKGKIYCGYALNEVVVSNGSTPRLITLALCEGKETVATYRADGLIVATPTGSTAYSLSAGGVVVDPRLKCFCVTPICPHSLTARPLMFPDSVSLEIVNQSQREKMVWLTLDGRQNYELYYGDSVCVTKAPILAKFLRIKPQSFYQTLRQKMSATEN
ncbi:MAG: NAD(+)/NADH kinase [Clostridia bacterium]|nr:NAD(+)/NADH kinase [Clostridia bacterium]